LCGVCAALVAAAAALAALAALVTRGRKVWEWGWGKYDAPVLKFLEERDRRAQLIQSPKPVYALPVAVEEIGRSLRRDPKHVLRSLRRLEKLGKVREYRGGWNTLGKPHMVNR
jgi:hypothetical protein